MDDTFTKMSIKDATAIPTKDDFYDVLTNRWWAATDDDCILFYSKYKARQCNFNKEVMERLLKKCSNHPATKIVFLPIVFLKHECKDYSL